jgi:flagellar biosynthesis anti-sigma factor FlgM
MKIDITSPAVSLLPADPGAKKISKGNVAGVQGATEDRTTLRTDSQSVQALTSQAMNSPEIRQDRVDALSLSIKTGEYKADASKTAGAIIASEG